MLPSNYSVHSAYLSEDCHVVWWHVCGFPANSTSYAVVAPPTGSFSGRTVKGFSVIIHKKGAKGGERSPQTSHHSLLNRCHLWRNTSVSRRGGKGGAVLPLGILQKALVRLAPSLLRVSSSLDPLSDFCCNHGWIFEGPELPFEVRGHLLQEPRGAGAGSRQLPGSKKLWVEAASSASLGRH